MDNDIGVVVILLVSLSLFAILALKSKAEWLLNLLMRGVLGIIGMYFVNEALMRVGISLGIGINPVSVLTTAILGVPGFLALYGLGLFHFL